MIVVTGASGKLGSRIVEHLLDKLPAEKIAVSVRDPAKIDAQMQRGVRVRHGDFTKLDSLASSFEGATQILIISSNARAYGGDSVAQHRSAIDAARASGARRIVYTSHMGASAASAFAPMHDHAATESILRDSGIAWTALRNGFYASTVPMMTAGATSSGTLAAPQDGKVSWTAHADLAAAAAALLIDEGRFDGPTPPLTAAEALDLDDIAAILSDLHQCSIQRQIITEREQAAGMARHGVPQAAIEMTLGLYRAAQAGEFAAVDPTLATLLGRAPMPLHDVLAAGSDV